MKSASLFVLVFAACSHTMTVDAVPAGSRISVEEGEVGGDEVTTTTSRGFLGSLRVKAEHDDYTPLEVEIERQQTSWPLLLTALGGCVTGGCLGAGCGLVTGLFVFPPNSPLWDGGPEAMMVAGSLLSGVPWLGLLLWMSSGPDSVSMDLESGRVATVPPSNYTVLQKPSPRPAASPTAQHVPTDQAEQPPHDQPASEASDTEEPEDDSEMLPFTY